MGRAQDGSNHAKGLVVKRRGCALRRRYGRAALCTASSVQALLFPRDRFNVAGSRAWAAKHDWKFGDVDVKTDFIHLRQADPSLFKRVRTVHFGGRGVLARVGWKVC
jgi:hypothetical protein